MSAEHRPAAALNNTAWNAAGKLSSTYIDTCIERGVLEPIVAHIGEYEQLAALWEQRRLRTKDFDYYRHAHARATAPGRACARVALVGDRRRRRQPL
jgi:hypothetical protein